MFDDAFLALVIPFAGKTPPTNWMLCQGQELPIPGYEELFSLIGNSYGGDGFMTFALPNLCERVAIHAGQGVGMQNYTAGATGGNEKVMITVDNLPAHTHELQGKITARPKCYSGTGTTSIPTGNYPATISASGAQFSTSPGDTIVMGKVTITTPTPAAPGVAGEAKEPVDIISPFLTMNYIICVKGLYPPQGRSLIF
jgi:microcystin-dependent protein